MFDFENSLLGKLYPGALGTAYLKKYYFDRINRHNDQYDEHFNKLYDIIIASPFYQYFDAANEIRQLSKIKNGITERDEYPLILDDDNLRVFINHIGKAVAFDFLVETKEFFGERFLTVSGVHLTYKEGKAENNGQLRRSGKGTEVSATFHFHDLLLSLDGIIPGGFKSRITNKQPFFSEVQETVQEYFLKFIDKDVARRSLEGVINRFAGNISKSSLPGFLYDYIKNCNPTYNYDLKDWVAKEILDMFGLRDVVESSIFKDNLSIK